MSDAFSLPADAAIVCHDAGAANVIVAGLQRVQQRPWRACMQGPAARIWEQAFGIPAPYTTVEEALESANFLLSGSGWASDAEHRARILARSAGVPSVTLLDHWVNYQPRFIRDGVQVLPDELWVTDGDALHLAMATFPHVQIKQVENWYLRQQLANVSDCNDLRSHELLYIAEPVRDDWQRGVAGEFQALDFFMQTLPSLALPGDLRVRIRPHPSDAPGKYDDWIAGQSKSNRVILLDDSPTMSAALDTVRWVAGCESYGLVLALAAGRTVFCTLPPWAPPCRLPQSGLIHLAALVR